MSETPAPYSAYDDLRGREQEAALLGAVLRRPALFAELREVINVDDFGWLAYRDVWDAMVTLSDNESGIDVLTIGDELERENRLADWVVHDNSSMTGRLALSLIRDTGQPQNARDYAANVKDYSAKRKIAEIMTRGVQWAVNGRRATDILTDLEQSLARVDTGAATSKNTISLREAVALAANRTDKASRGEITYLESGYPALDNIIVGFSAPELTLIAGRPGQGKTALLASIADNISRTGKRIAFFTLEMANEQVAMRFISMRSGVSYHAQKKGKLTYEEWQDYNQAVEQLDTGNYNLILNDMPAITPNRVRQELRRLWPVDIVMLDYLQLAGTDKRYESRHLEVGAISAALVGMAKEFQIPIVAAAQLSREVEKRSGGGERRPILSDLGESGKLEQDASNVIFIHRPTDSGDIADIIVAKQRNGPVGVATLKYVGFKTRFESQ